MRLSARLGVVLLLAACGRTEVFELAPEGAGGDLGAAPEGADAGRGRDGGACAGTLAVTHRLTVAGPGGLGRALPYRGGFVRVDRTAGPARLLRTELRTGREVVVAGPEGELAILDADAERSVFVRAQAGAASLWLEDRGALRALPEGSGGQGGFGAEPRRQLTEEFVAYCGEGGWALHVDALSTGQRFSSLVQDGVRCEEPLFMEGRDLVHRGRDAAGRAVIVHYRVGDGGSLPRVVASGGELAMPALRGGRLYYLRDGFLVSQALEPGAAWTTLSADLCASLSVGASGVIASCGVDTGAWPYAPGKYLLLHDGSATTTLEFPDRALRYTLTPRVGDGLVAWLEYEDPDVLCRGRFDAPAGRVMLAALPRGPVLEVAPIYAGCFCCGAVWPDPQLELRDDVLVFNYDASAGGVMSREGGLGAGLIETVCTR